LNISPPITLHPTPASAPGLPRFTILPALDPPPPIAAAIDQLWADLKLSNPRLFDGPILITETLADMRLAGDSHVLTARRASYKTLATAADVGMSVRALGVQGIVTARDERGVQHLLLGRRSSEVRIYQGLWENAPSGTIPPPPPEDTAIDDAHYVRALLAEGIEEVGLDLNRAAMSFAALLDDAHAQSLDIVLKLAMDLPIDPRALPCPSQDCGRWEYADTAWIALPDLPAWSATNAHAISPPTLTLLRWITSETS
jgi:hypothetical protein